MQVPSLASLSGLRIGVAVSCGVGCRRGSDLALLWLWCRLVDTAPIRPLAWEPPYAASAARKRQEKEKLMTGIKQPSLLLLLTCPFPIHTPVQLWMMTTTVNHS